MEKESHKAEIIIVILISLAILSYIVGSKVDVSTLIHNSGLTGIFLFLVFVPFILYFVLMLINNKRPIGVFFGKAFIVHVCLMICFTIMLCVYPEEKTHHYHVENTRSTTTDSNTNSSSNRHSSSSGSNSSSDYNAQDYDDPDDYYNDHDGDYEDYEEAEDDWYDYN